MHAGTQNLGAPLRVRVTVAEATVLSGIVALLERAQAERPRLAEAADRAAAWFLSRILIGAAVVFVAWWFVDPAKAFPATLAVLVVTCPCALSLATPACWRRPPPTSRDAGCWSRTRTRSRRSPRRRTCSGTRPAR